VTPGLSSDPESYSDDPASQQLLVEAHTPRSIPLPSINDSIVRSAHLLNAARADKLTVTGLPATKLNGMRGPSTLSSGRNVAPRNTAGKLSKIKKPSFSRVDLAGHKKVAPGKRKDIYAHPESPTKDGEGEIILPQAVNRKPLKVVKDKRKKAKSPELSIELATSEVEAPDLSALEVAPELTPELTAPELVSDVHVPKKQEVGTQIVPESSMLAPRSSPPHITTETPASTTVELLLTSGQPRCTNFSNESENKGKQCLQKGTIKVNDEWRCTHHAKTRHSRSRLDSPKEALGPRASKVHTTEILSSPQDQTYTAPRKYPKRKAETGQLEAGNALKSPRIQKAKPNTIKEVGASTDSFHDRPQIRRSKPVVMIPARKSSNLANSAQGGRTAKEAEPGVEEERTLIAEHEEEVPNTTSHRKELPVEAVTQEPAKNAGKTHEKIHAGPRRSARANPQSKQTSSGAAKSAGNRRTHIPDKAPQRSQAVQMEVETTQQDAEEEACNQAGQASNAQEDATSETEADEVEDEVQEDDANQFTELDRVFKFLDCQERDGDCQTAEGIELYEACRGACELIINNNIPLQEISDTVDTIRQKLTTTRSITGEKREFFKVDAYGHLFRSLTRFLESVHDWAVHNADTVGHLSALRLVTPLVRDIISFKDTLASWSTFHRRYREDRNIKQVEQNLIVPLRKVAQAYRAELEQLEHIEKNRKKREKLQALRQEQEEEEERKTEAQRAYKEKAKIWQYLEIARLMCEPDIHRRRMLIPPKRDKAGERDANGVVFDRVPLFLPRETPPPLAPNIKLKPWTDDESTTLAEALQRFAGMYTSTLDYNIILISLIGPSPHKVFEMIFQHYCRPGDPLRRFNVTDIVTRAAHRRAEYIKLYHLHGWEVDEWIKQIPILL
jgi:hypothetical protein